MSNKILDLLQPFQSKNIGNSSVLYSGHMFTYHVATCESKGYIEVDMIGLLETQMPFETELATSRPVKTQEEVMEFINSTSRKCAARMLNPVAVLNYLLNGDTSQCFTCLRFVKGSFNDYKAFGSAGLYIIQGDLGIPVSKRQVGKRFWRIMYTPYNSHVVKNGEIRFREMKTYEEAYKAATEHNENALREKHLTIPMINSTQEWQLPKS
jgi:hypothetical protein